MDIIRNADVNKTWFQERMKERGIKQNTLAAKLNLDKGGMSKSLKGIRHFTAKELGALSLLLQQPFTEVAKHAGIEFWQPDMPTEVKNRAAEEAIQALARALGLTL